MSHWHTHEKKQDRNINAAKERGFLGAGRNQNHSTSTFSWRDMKGLGIFPKYLELKKKKKEFECFSVSKMASLLKTNF